MLTKNIPRKLFVGSSLSLVLGLIFGFLLVINPTSTYALSGSDFNAGRIIDDVVFFNPNAMSSTQVQAFLNAKVPSCDTNRARSSSPNDPGPPYICLKDYRQNIPTRNPEDQLCHGITASNNRSAAQIIDIVARSCGVSQKVLIVLLEKEQSLVTDDWPWPIQYRSATGYGCPDTAPCDSEYYGFFNQVYNAARIYKYYAKYSSSFNHLAGRNNNILFNPNGNCGKSSVYIENQATAGLYNYTPYQPNSAALSNLYGTGNSCSAYGNRNFWRLFNDWFGSTYSSLVFRIGSSSQVYLDFGGVYYPFPSRDTFDGFGFQMSEVRSESSSYINNKTQGPNLSRLVRFEGPEIYLIDNGQKHHFPNQAALNNFGYSVGQETTLTEYMGIFFPSGTSMTDIVKSTETSHTFLVQSTQKRHFSRDYYVSQGSPVYSTRPLATLTPAYLEQLVELSPLLLDDIFTQSSDTNETWFWDGNSKIKINEQVFSQWAEHVNYTETKPRLELLPTSPSTEVGLFAKNGSTNYLLDRDTKFTINSSLFENLGLTAASFVTVPPSLLNKFASTSDLKDLVRISASNAIYKLIGGELFHINSPQAMTTNGFSFAEVRSISNFVAGTFNSTPKKIFAEGLLTRINNSQEVYVTDGFLKYRHVANPGIFRAYGFSFANVYNVTASSISGYIKISPLSYYAKNSGTAFLVDGSARRTIIPDLLDDYGLDLNTVISISDTLKNQLNIWPNATNLIQAPGDPKVYRIEGGQKRWFTTAESFTASGAVRSDIRQVSASYVQSLNSGPNI